MNGEEIVGPYGYNPTDADLAQKIGEWLIDHEGEYTVAPLIPVALTPEQLRAQMPNLNDRQFWMAAAQINIDKDVIVTAIKAEMPDTVDRNMMIAELESGLFERLKPTIIDVMAILRLTRGT